MINEKQDLEEESKDLAEPFDNKINLDHNPNIHPLKSNVIKPILNQDAFMQLNTKNINNYVEVIQKLPL